MALVGPGQFTEPIWTATVRPTKMVSAVDGSATITLSNGHTVQVPPELAARVRKMVGDGLIREQMGAPAAKKLTQTMPEVSQPSLNRVARASGSAAKNVRNGLLSMAEKAKVRVPWKAIGQLSINTALVQADYAIWNHNLGMMGIHIGPIGKVAATQGTTTYSGYVDAKPVMPGDMMWAATLDGAGPAPCTVAGACVNGAPIVPSRGFAVQWSTSNARSGAGYAAVTYTGSYCAFSDGTPRQNDSFPQFVQTVFWKTVAGPGSSCSTNYVQFFLPADDVEFPMQEDVPSDAVTASAPTTSAYPTDAPLSADALLNGLNNVTQALTPAEGQALGYLANRAQYPGATAPGAGSTTTLDPVEGGSKTDPITTPPDPPATLQLQGFSCTSYAGCVSNLRARGFTGTINRSTRTWSTAVTTKPADAPLRYRTAQHDFPLPIETPVEDLPDVEITIEDNPDTVRMPAFVPGLEGDDEGDNGGTREEFCDQLLRDYEQLGKDFADREKGLWHNYVENADWLAQKTQALLDKFGFADKGELFAALAKCQNGGDSEAGDFSKQRPSWLKYALAAGLAGLVLEIHLVDPDSISTDLPHPTLPGQVIGTPRPAPGTKSQPGTSKESKPDVELDPSQSDHPGTSTAAPGSHVQVDVIDFNAPVRPDGTVTASPATPTDGGGGSDGGGPDVPGLNLDPLKVPTLCTKFPFGVPCWLGQVVASWVVDPVPPHWKVVFPFVSDADAPYIDFGIWDPYMAFLRGLFLIVFTVGVVLRFMALATNRGDGGEE